jgi:hypothetical protein
MRPNAAETEAIPFRAHLRSFAKVSASMDKQPAEAVDAREVGGVLEVEHTDIRENHEPHRF